MSEARQYGSKHLAAMAAEGVSSKAYARREGWAVASLYFWRRRLKEGETGGSAVVAGRGFVAVHVADVGRRAAYALRLASGLRLELQERPAPEWLAALAVAFERVR